MQLLHFLQKIADTFLNILNVECTLQAAWSCSTWSPPPSVCWLPAACMVSWNNDTVLMQQQYRINTNITIIAFLLQLKYCRPAGAAARRRREGAETARAAGGSPVQCGHPPRQLLSTCQAASALFAAARPPRNLRCGRVRARNEEHNCSA